MRSRLHIQEDRDWSAVPADGEAMFSYDDRPISGRSAPWGLDLDVRRVGREAIATLTLDAAHEGAPGRSHGGVVAALFDDVFGFVIDIESDLPAFTGELTIRYERATPLARAARMPRADGAPRRSQAALHRRTDERSDRRIGSACRPRSFTSAVHHRQSRDVPAEPDRLNLSRWCQAPT